MQWALTGGEDYQLLVTVPPRHASKASSFTCIGSIKKAPGLTLDGERILPKGFDHFGR